jgi:hypothetical protein
MCRINHLPLEKVTAPRAESMSLPLPLKFPRTISVTAETQIEAAAWGALSTVASVILEAQPIVRRDIGAAACPAAA